MTALHIALVLLALVMIPVGLAVACTERRRLRSLAPRRAGKDRRRPRERRTRPARRAHQ